MNLEIIREKYNNGEYTPKIKEMKIGNLIPLSKTLNSAKNPLFDKNKTMAENEQIVKNHNAMVSKEQNEMKKRIQESYNNLMHDIIMAIKEIIHVNDEKARIIYDKVYDNHHSGGMMDIFMELDEELNYLIKILQN